MSGPEDDALGRRRRDRLAWLVALHKQDMGERLAETKRLFERPVWAVDPHTHSSYSDGTGRPADNREMAEKAGLDFFFQTDHNSLGQKRAIKGWANASWGQEPVAGPHHLGLLRGKRLFKPKQTDLRADFEAAEALAEFVWVAHPGGWYPVDWYTEEQVAALWNLPDRFAMELLNGAHRVFRAWDRFNARAVATWDRLLCDGRHVVGVGASDAHSPEQVGVAWTGIYAPRPTAKAIIQALQAGRCFASEAGLVDLTVDGQPMGSVLERAPGTSLELSYRAADAAGIASIRLVSGGRVIKTISGKGEPVVEGTLGRRMPKRPTYFRLELIATDDRRAFSNPLYAEPPSI